MSHWPLWRATSMQSSSGSTRSATGLRVSRSTASWLNVTSDCFSNRARAPRAVLALPSAVKTHSEPAPRVRSAPPPRAGRPAPPQPQESDVMRDARAVAEGRKRRLGFDQE